MAEGFLSRRQFVAGSAALAMAGMFGALTGCTAGGSGAAAGADTASASTGGDAAASTDPITMVWLPDNSSADLTSSREAIGAAITAACGREANLLTTTDYNVAIESIASGKAQMALLGPEGYVQANKKNPKVLAAFTNSDEDGGLEGACYYSRICVRKEDADQYKSGSGYSIENIKGKSFSFVSATSTSGFKVPSSGIVSEFGLDSSDEPIASLDPKSSRTVMEHLRWAADELGVACLANLHQVDFAMEFSDRIVALKKGRVVFDGAPHLLDEAAIADIYGTNEEAEAGSDFGERSVRQVGELSGSRTREADPERLGKAEAKDSSSPEVAA